jgi:hypothetical protein
VTRNGSCSTKPAGAAGIFGWSIDDPATYLRKRRDFRANAYLDDADTLADLNEEELWALEEEALENGYPPRSPNWNQALLRAVPRVWRHDGVPA